MLAIILSILTFIIGSILITVLIFYFAGLPFSSLQENQLYVFFAILISAILASMVYGRGTKHRAREVANYLNEKLDLDIKGEDIAGLLRLLERFPPFVVNSYIETNINVVKEFELPIKEQISKLKNEDLKKINIIMGMPTIKIQELLNDLYLITNLEQFKILAEPRAKPLIELNMIELEKILSKNKH